VLKQAVRGIPLVGPALTGAARAARRHAFPGSAAYWERHYARGGDSGEGSQGDLARFKAEVLNDFVAACDIGSVVEFGCGDGRQLALARYPRYLGLDVSPTTLRRVVTRFADDPAKSFLRYDPACFTDAAGFIGADAALSLDVIYHLIENDVYHRHLRHVFAAARRFVVLYTSDADRLPGLDRTAPHVRHRPVARDVARAFPGWRLRERIPNRYDTSFADFLIYERPAGTGAATGAGTCAASAG
jgi:SAM-dependent methyltransferase